MTDIYLPDGDGTTLLPLLRRSCPEAQAIVITGRPTIDKTISAMRQGAADFLLKPFAASELAQRVDQALARGAAFARTQRRLGKLRSAGRRLNEARKVVTRKVDLLCNDLIAAYGELAQQLDLVRTQEGFKHFVGQAKDLEQLLCHTMDYLMRQMGYCNIAIWLSGEGADYQLGAYMKFTMAGEQSLTEAMGKGMVPKVGRDGFAHWKQDALQEALTPAELDYLADQDVIAANCTYLGETLGVVVCFRDHDKGFSDRDEACLKTVSPLFAVSLAAAVRPTSDDEKHEEPPREDEWWKNGQEPPF